MKHIFTLALAALSCAVMAQSVPCNGSTANGFPCSNIDLAAYMSISDLGGGQNLNDNWGWIDAESGREFALIGRSNGTSFVEITDPVNPIYLGNLPTHTTEILWRDVKIFNNYAFIVAEAGGHGMQVFDLTQLLEVDGAPLTFEEDAHYDGYGNAHNIVICEETGYAYGVGTNTASGGLHIVDINDPLNPVIAGLFAEDGYTHDAQVVVYTGPDQSYFGKELAFACNEDELSIVDCTMKDDCVLAGKSGYPDNVYAHQGWLTEDHKYFILNDEIDENSGLAPFTRTHVFDVQDIEDPQYIGFYEGSVTSSDHNLYTMGNLVVMGNYRSGVRILQMNDLSTADMNELAYFDTDPFSDAPGYTGVWNCYPYFPSGTMIASDMFSGLFILSPNWDAIDALNVEEQGPSTLPVFNLSPNPASDAMNLSFEGFHPAKDHEVKIFDRSGRLVVQSTVNPAFSPISEVNITELKSGVYTVFIEGWAPRQLVKH